MKPRRKCHAFLLAGLLLAAGCTSRESLYADLRAARQEAYGAWQREKEAASASAALLKGGLGLTDAIKLALRHNKKLQAALAERRGVRSGIVSSYKAALPTISVGSAYVRLDEAISGMDDTYSNNLTVTQPIFRGSAIPAALSAARLAACLADEAVRAAVQMAVFEAASAYYDAVLAEHLFAVNEEAVKSAQAHLDEVTKKKQQGVASDYDVLRAQVDVSNFRAAMIQQQNKAHLAKAQLLQVMGVSQRSDVRLVDDLDYVAMRPVLERAVAIAFQQRPELLQAELGVRLQEEALRVAKSAYWPTIAVFYTREWQKPESLNPPNNTWAEDWQVGASATLPLFDIEREGKVLQEKAGLKQKQIMLLDAQERVLLDIEQTILTLRDAEELVESQRLNLDRAREALRLVEVGYQNGVNTEVEVTDARSALTQARGFYYQALYAHTIARLNLQRAMGILCPPPGVGEAPAAPPVPPARIEEFAAGADEKTADTQTDAAAPAVATKPAAEIATGVPGKPERSRASPPPAPDAARADVLLPAQ